MTEKRSEYRKNIKRQNIFQNSDNDVKSKDFSLISEDEENLQIDREEKISRLKRKLNWAILIVIILIIIVLFVLFKL